METLLIFCVGIGFVASSLLWISWVIEMMFMCETCDRIGLVEDDGSYVGSHVCRPGYGCKRWKRRGR